MTVILYLIFFLSEKNCNQDTMVLCQQAISECEGIIDMGRIPSRCEKCVKECPSKQALLAYKAKT